MAALLHRKPLVWKGSSRKDLIAMPEALRKEFGVALDLVQQGLTPEGAKPLKGRVAGAVQLAEDHRGEAYRAIYTVELAGVVYVLHCFHKKAKRAARPRRRSSTSSRHG